MASNKTVGAKNVGSQKIAQKPTVKFDDNLFLAGLIGALKTNNSIQEDSSIETINDAVDEIKELWLMSHAYELNGGFKDALSAIQDITTYIVDNSYVYVAPVLYNIDGFTVQLCVPTKIPGVSATFALHCTPTDIDFDGALLGAYDTLKAFASSHFKPTSQSQQSNTPNKSDTPLDEPFEFETLRATIFNNKMVYRLIPLEGRWAQFGVPLYADEATKAGINLNDYQDAGDYTLVGDALIQYKPDGKPMRSKNITVS